MKKYTSKNPVFSEEINIVERADLVNDQNKTEAEKQLLQNDLVLKKQMDTCLGENGRDGNLGLAEGIKADNLVGAVNEVFRLGSEKKKQLVENLTALGIAASTNETWEMLLNKVLRLMDTSGANAVAGDILFGKKAAVKGSLIAGTMPNKGAWTGNTTGSGNVPIPEGYHNGQGHVSGQGAYNKGVTDADNRANPNSANYKSGYNAGVNAADGRVNADSANYKGGYNAGVSATKKGTASAGDVLSGKTFTNNSSVGAGGTMPNKGAWTGNTTGSGNVPIPEGYHNGQGHVSGQGAYNKGVTDADNRANPNSANYKSGYNAGVNAADGRVNADSANYKGGYNAGVSATKKGTAGAGDVLSGKTFTNSSSVEASGTMANKGNTTQDATVTQDNDYTYLAIPASGYYDTNSKLRTKNSNLAKVKTGTYVTDKVPVCLALGFRAKYFFAVGTINGKKIVRLYNSDFDSSKSYVTSYDSTCTIAGENLKTGSSFSGGGICITDTAVYAGHSGAFAGGTMHYVAIG